MAHEIETSHPDPSAESLSRCCPWPSKVVAADLRRFPCLCGPLPVSSPLSAAYCSPRLQMGLNRRPRPFQRVSPPAFSSQSCPSSRARDTCTGIPSTRFGAPLGVCTCVGLVVATLLLRWPWANSSRDMLLFTGVDGVDGGSMRSGQYCPDVDTVVRGVVGRPDDLRGVRGEAGGIRGLSRRAPPPPSPPLVLLCFIWQQPDHARRYLMSSTNPKTRIYSRGVRTKRKIYKRTISETSTPQLPQTFSASRNRVGYYMSNTAIVVQCCKKIFSSALSRQMGGARDHILFSTFRSFR